MGGNASGVRGVKTRFSVSRCCCACQDCCNGNAPDEIDVTIEFDDAMCETCGSLLSGTYTLQRSEGEICSWGIVLRKTATGWYEVCQDDYAGYNDEITLLAIAVEIRCGGTTEYQATAFINLARQYATGSELSSNGVTRFDTRNATHSNTSYYVTKIPVSEWECDSGNTITLDWVFTILRGNLEVFIGPASNNWYFGSAYKLIIGSPLPPFVPQVMSFSGVGLLILPVCQPPTSIDVAGVP